MNIKLTVAYDGTDFLGWQRTPEGPSIQETLQKALEQILQHSVDLQAASRTDAGVHANGQVVNFFTHKAIRFSKLCIGLNALLPSSIVVIHAEEMPQNFHPTLDCKGKEYHYHLCPESFQMPQFRLYSWHCHQQLKTSHMQEAAKHLIGTHDFSAFCNTKKNEPYEHCIRTVNRIEIIHLPENRLRIEVEGNHFLYKMVRNIVGTLVSVGKGVLQPDEILKILSSKDRTLAGMTAPAHGLTLQRVKY